MLARILNFVKTHHSDIVLFFAIICITVISFNLGRGMGQGSTKNQLTVISPAVGTSSPQIDKPAIPKDTRVVVSKASSSKAFHFMYCPGAKKIAEKNKLFFASEVAAISAGYTLAGNCQK